MFYLRIKQDPQRNRDSLRHAQHGIEFFPLYFSGYLHGPVEIDMNLFLQLAEKNMVMHPRWIIVDITCRELLTKL